jgi:adenine phosphoribosyltransferase
MAQGPEATSARQADHGLAARLRGRVRDVPDFPKKGIVFKDLSPALADPDLLEELLEAQAAPWRQRGISKVVGIESRGFIFGAPLAYLIGAGFVMVRKPGKLPYRSHREAYDLEYGQSALELHIDAVHGGERVLVVDDLLATGGTAQAVGKLIARLGGELVGYSFVVELAALRGAAKLGGEVHALLRYE